MDYPDGRVRKFVELVVVAKLVLSSVSQKRKTKTSWNQT
jgi:hypothetical protein